MNRWSWLAVVAMTVALPALAQDRWGDWERERGRDRGFREQPVSIEKRRMQWKLERIDRKLGELLARARPPDRKALKDIRDEVTDVRDLLNAATPLGPPSLPQPPAVQPGPPPGYQQPPAYQQPPPGYQQPPPGYQQPPPPGYQQPPPGYQQPPPAQPILPAAQPMPEPAFRNLLATMSRESFASGRLRVLEQAAPSNWFVVQQVQQVLAQFEFPQDRLNAVRILQPRIVDPNNAFQLYGAFELPRDKDELRRILGQ
jgi:uncharacterized protein DUF4476